MVVYLRVPMVVNLSVDYVFPFTLTTTEIHLLKNKLRDLKYPDFKNLSGFAS